MAHCISQVKVVDIIDCLPTLPTAFFGTALAKFITRFPSDDVFLGETPTWMFGEAEAWQVASRFRQRLRDIETEMVKRNKNLRVPYTVLYPSRITTGTGK